MPTNKAKTVQLPTRFRLEQAIEDWDNNPNQETYTKAVWALGVDAALGRIGYIQDDPMSHLRPSAQHRLFVAHLETDTLKSPAEIGFKVVGLMDLMQSILRDDEPGELEIALCGKKNFAVPEIAIDRLIEQITNALDAEGKEDGHATKS